MNHNQYAETPKPFRNIFYINSCGDFFLLSQIQKTFFVKWKMILKRTRLLTSWTRLLNPSIYTFHSSLGSRSFPYFLLAAWKSVIAFFIIKKMKKWKKTTNNYKAKWIFHWKKQFRKNLTLTFFFPKDWFLVIAKFHVSSLTTFEVTVTMAKKKKKSFNTDSEYKNRKK